MLTVQTADQVVELVAADLVSCARIEGPTLNGIFSRLHIAGHVRNLALLLAGLNPEEAQFARVSCIGITEATTKAISEAALAGSLLGVRASFRVYRILDGYSHWGSNVVLNDGSDYVFDWFPTLEPENPILYRYRDWVVDRDGVEYWEFDGTLPPTP